MAWSWGYETGVEYTFGYYRELAPPMLRFALLVAGWRPPPIRRYLELGAGRGLSTNIHAAANPIDAVCTDFIPSHVVDASDLAEASGARVFEDSFEDTLARLRAGTLEPFDAIVFHGVYSWVSPERRRELREICRIGLKPGGVVYNSYNALPGWASVFPLQRLFRMYAHQLAITTDPIAQKTKEAVVLARQLQEGKAAYMVANPTIVQRLNSLTDQMLNYVVHEYQNEAWDCFYFFDVASDFETECKLSFASSASILDIVPSLRNPPNAQEMLDDIASPIMREQVRDYWVNAAFRKDIFLRGAPRLSQAQQWQMLKDTRVVAQIDRKLLTFKAKGPSGDFTMNEEVYAPVFDAVVAEGKPIRVEDVQKRTGLPLPVVLEVVAVLVATSYLAPCHEEAVTAKQRPKCKALNKIIRERAKNDAGISCLASPVTGAGVTVGRMDQLFLSAIEAGHKTIEARADYAFQTLRSAGEALQDGGKALTDQAEAVAHIATFAKAFEEDRLPTLKVLGLV